MAQVDEVALTQRAQQLLARLRLLTGAALIRLWDGLPSHREDEQTRWATLAGPVVLAGQNRAIDTQLAYVRARLGEEIAFDREELLALATVDLSGPFISLATSLRNGDALTAALDAGRSRADELAHDAVSWASRSANAAVADNKRIVGWRRVLTGQSCEWCQVISTQRYRSQDSATFGHGHCDCSVAPIIGDSDPGRVINRQLLNELKASGAVKRVTRPNRKH